MAENREKRRALAKDVIFILFRSKVRNLKEEDDHNLPSMIMIIHYWETNLLDQHVQPMSKGGMASIISTQSRTELDSSFKSLSLTLLNLSRKY
jgi:hypothetical protein